MKGIQAFAPLLQCNSYSQKENLGYNQHDDDPLTMMMMMISNTPMIGPPGAVTALDVIQPRSFVSDATSLLIGSDFEPAAQTFEPQVNTPALFSFAIIAVVFTLLQIRINSVRDASNRREKALKLLRQVKSEQLSFPESSSLSATTITNNNNSNSNDDDKTNIEKKSRMEQRVKNALNEYEVSLKEELNLRTIIPGVRIVAPNDAARREEDISAAKQFLGLDILLDDDKGEDNKEDSKNSDINGVANRIETTSRNDLKSNTVDGEDEDSKKNNLLMQSRRRFDRKESNQAVTSENDSLSNGAKAILITVALSQIALLVLLSMDPMNANQMFTDISGNPPANMELGSWSN